MIWIGVLIVVIAIWAIVKQYDSKLVLLGAGMAMAIISGHMLDAVNEFLKMMVNSSLVPIICTVMGFSYVMKLTKCDANLVNWLLRGMPKNSNLILIPASVLVTAMISIALPSAAGASAAVGSILIPALIRAGVYPAIAASAVVAGVWGGSLSPGTANNNIVAKLANVDIMVFIQSITTAVVVGMIINAMAITLVAFWRKEHTGYTLQVKDDGKGNIDIQNLKIDYLKAMMPIIPLVLLVLGSKAVQVLPYMPVPHAMLIGAVLALAIEWRQAPKVSQAFFDGMGHAFGGIIGIIMAAMVFAAGLKSIGIIGVAIDMMKTSPAMAKWFAAFGTFGLAILSGSGDAATLAFNTSITPHAAQFGMTILDLGATATITGHIGRSLSLVSACCIVCATLAGVSTLEMAKRNALGLFSAAIAVLFIQLF